METAFIRPDCLVPRNDDATRLLCRKLPLPEVTAKDNALPLTEAFRINMEKTFWNIFKAGQFSLFDFVIILHGFGQVFLDLRYAVSVGGMR
jgi:hypothetical protein